MKKNKGNLSKRNSFSIIIKNNKKNNNPVKNINLKEINSITTRNRNKYNYNYIPDIISDMLLLLYELNKKIREKAIKNETPFYLINSNFLIQIKNLYNYKKICEELEKEEYKDIENNIESIKSKIKIKNIISEELPIEDVSIRPKTLELYSTTHLVNFSIVNSKILDIIKKLYTHYNFKGEMPRNSFKFYFYPEIFYIFKKFKSKVDFMKIISLNEDYSFNLEYFITIDLYKKQISLDNMIEMFIESKDLKTFFNKFNIDISKGKQSLMYNFTSFGEVINFSIPEFNNNNEINSIKTTEFKQRISRKNSIKKTYSPPKSKNEEENLDNFNIKSFEQIKNTPMIGLQNIGQTCYMNAALQCFSNTKSLTKYFLNYGNLQFIKNNVIAISDQDEPQLVREYLKLLRHLWCDNPKSSYAPYDFKQKIGIIEPLFKNFEANDAKDFVNFMIMRLHEELNGIDGNLIKQNNLIQPTLPLNPYNQVQILQSYLYEFQLNFNSFISNCFYGTTQGEFECQVCKSQLFRMGQNMPLTKFNYQTFFFLNFPLDEVRKYVLSNKFLYMKYMNSNINPNLVINLYDCFYYYQKDELLSCYCDRCNNNNAQVISRTKIYIAPIYLIILLNRGKGIQFNIKITFPEILNTNGIFVNPCGDYYLYGVVKHFGESSSSGHFTAYCRSPVDNLWYFYNDSIVVPVNENEKYKIEENGLTYMLFYSQMNK